MYERLATGRTPALVIYLVDVSDSMNEPCGSSTKIEIVNKSLRGIIRAMARRSLRHDFLRSRYKIALFGYNTRVFDVLGGIRDLTDLVNSAIPELTASGKTDTATGFAAVEKLLL